MNTEVVKNHLKKNYPFYIISALAAVVYFAVIYPAINNDLIYYDSVYQYFLTNKSFGEMLELIPKDYSPALYSIFLKAFSLVFGTTINQMRLSSVVVFGGLVLTSIFPLRRAFGDKMAIIMSLCFIFSSSSFQMYGEIRPHVLGLLFVTTASVYAYLIYKSGSKHEYVMFTIFSILSMNTHNVAMFTMFTYYVLLFVVFLFARKYKEIKKLVISGIISVIFYIPSLIVIIGQFSNIRNNYWEDGNINMLRILLNTLFLNVNNTISSEFPTYLFVLCFAFELLVLGIVLFIIARAILDYSKTKKFKLAIDSDSCFVIGLFVAPIGFFYFIVKFVVPIMAERYLYMLSGIALIVVVYLLNKIDKKNIVLCILALLFVVNFVITTNNYHNYVKANNDYVKIEALKDQYGDDIAFVHAYEWTVGEMEYYFPTSRHYITDNTHTIITTYDVYSTENIINVGDPSNISNYEDEFIIIFVNDSYLDWNAYEYYSNSEEYICDASDFNYSSTYRYAHFERVSE